MVDSLADPSYQHHRLNDEEAFVVAVEKAGPCREAWVHVSPDLVLDRNFVGVEAVGRLLSFHLGY